MIRLKKAFGIFLAVLMILSAIPFSASAATTPAKPKSISATSTASSVKVKWSKVSGASGYTVYRYYSSTKKSTKLVNTKNLYYTASKLKAANTYSYYVKAYKKSGKKTYYSKASSKVYISTRPAKVTGLKKTSQTYGKASFSWNKVSGATGYKVVVAKDSGFKNIYKNYYPKTNSVSVTGLADNVAYYVRVYAYRTYNKKNYYGSVSSYVTCKITVATTTVKDTTTYQTMLGFGCSSAWWSKTVGGWDDTRDDIMELLYGKTKGIGLNVYRYNLGAGSDKDETVVAWNRAESFLDDSGKLDFSKDASAQKCLETANSINPNLRVTLFANSAPYQYTSNGKTYSDYNPFNDGDSNEYDPTVIFATNLDVSHYKDFANYVVDCAKYFKGEGYNVTDVSPINEPECGWQAYSNGTSKQEGCHFDYTSTRAFYLSMYNALEENNMLDDTQLSVFESGQIGDGHSSFSKYLSLIFQNEKLKNYVNSISGHSYYIDGENDTRTGAAIFLKNSFPDKPFRMTEYCQLIGGTSGLGIDKGIDLANTICDDLTLLNATEWDWWVGVAGGDYCDGLVYVNANDHSYYTSKRLYTLGNYSKFINEGAKRVYLSENSSALRGCAFKNTDGSLVIVYINSSTSEQSTKVSASGYSSYSTYVTDKSSNLANKTNGSFSSGTRISVPASSVTTVVLK